MATNTSNESHKDLTMLSKDGSNLRRWDREIREGLAKETCLEFLIEDFSMEVTGESHLSTQVKRQMIVELAKTDKALSVELRKLRIEGASVKKCGYEFQTRTCQR